MHANRNRHVAIVVDSIAPGGGVNNAALSQAKALSNHFSITLVCAHGSLQHEKIQLEKVQEPKLFWLKRLGHAVRAFILSRRFCAALKKIDAQKHIDFVLFHSHLHASTAHKKLRDDLKLALVVHGDIFTRPRGTYDPLLTLLYKKSSLKAYKTLDLTIALSPNMRGKVISYGAPKAKTAVIPNGLEHKRLAKREARNSTDKTFQLLFVGRLSKEKDPLTLLAAMTQVDNQVCLTMIGDGPLKKDIQNYIHAHLLNHRVKLLGHISADKVSALYRQSDALCAASVSDPLPTVVLEAMNSGLAVIGTDVGGIPFMIKHEKTGLVVQPSNAHSLAKAITKLLNSPRLCQEFGTAGNRRIQEKFDLNTVTQLMVKKINSAID